MRRQRLSLAKVSYVHVLHIKAHGWSTLIHSLLYNPFSPLYSAADRGHC